MLEVLTLMGIGFVGTIIWPISPEASAVFYGSQLGWSALAVGLTVAVAQLPAYALLYFGGERLVGRWKWLARKVSRTKERLDGQVSGSYLVLTGVGAIFGIPPVIAMCALGSGFEVSARTLMPVVFLGRIVRFSTLAGGGVALSFWT